MRYELDFGSINAGGAPSFMFFVNADTGAAVAPQPVFVERSSGAFYFDFDFASFPGIFAISYKAQLNGTEVSGVLSGDSTSAGVLASHGVPGKTLAVLRTEVLEALKESVSTRGLIPDQAALNRWINRAHKWAWGKATGANPDNWKVRGAPATFSFAAGALSVATLCGGTFPNLVHEVRVLKDDGTWSNPIENVEGDDRGRWEPGPAQRTMIPRGWYIQGASLYFTPEPTRDWSVKAVYLPGAPDLVADADVALNGMLDDQHDIIVYRACQLLMHKGEAGKTPWDADVADALRDFTSAARRGMAGSHSRRIRNVSHYGSRNR